MQPEGFDFALGASYQLVEVIGRGATGEVWRAEHRRTGEAVAAKLLLPEHLADRELVGRFLGEKAMLTALRHPNIVQVRDLIAEGDRLAIVMEFVDGGSLRDALTRRGTLPPALAVGVTAIVLDALAVAHGQSVVHRDVKPDNILLADGWWSLEPGQVKIVDFGISEILTERAGAITGGLGTPQYMAPELTQRGTADGSADVYGVGVMLYELLAGRTPFAGPGSPRTVAQRHVDYEPPPLPLPAGVWAVLSSFLDKDPDRRPSATAAAAALRAVAPQLTSLPPLAKAAAPPVFEAARGPMTLIRNQPDVEPEAEPAPREPVSGAVPDDLDLGTPSEVTTVKAAPVRPSHVDRTSRERERPVESRPTWRDPRVIAVVVGALVLILGAVVFVTRSGGGDAAPTAGPSSTLPVDAGPITTQQQDQPLKTGLTVMRKATYDPTQGTVALTITYSAQKAPLTGPFLEVLPGLAPGDPCPQVVWAGGDQQPNLPSVTGITTDCGWSLDVGTVAAQSDVTVEATVALALGTQDPTTALSQWLDGAAGQTGTAVTDPSIKGQPSYPVQRLTDIQVIVPDSILTKKNVAVKLLPVWPDGPDPVHPIYRSDATGDATSLLTAVAGGESGLKFSSGCGSALNVVDLLVSANFAGDCTLDVQVGNFTDLVSNTVTVTDRGR